LPTSSSSSKCFVSAVIDTVKCAKDVSLSFGSSGDNPEPNGLGVKFGTNSIRFLSSIFDNVVSVVPVSQNDDDLAGVSIINDDVGEVAGREEDEIAFGDNKDPDAEDVPPDDRLLEVTVAGNRLWNVDERFPSNGELSDIV
jgi:hypothetical protein